jgi:hypothetical protein
MSDRHLYKNDHEVIMNKQWDEGCCDLFEFHCQSSPGELTETANRAAYLWNFNQTFTK